VQEAGGEEMVVGKRDAISVGCKEACEAVGDAEGEALSMVAMVTVGVGVGKLCGSVGGIWVGVAAEGRLSARDRKMPPITSITETTAMITPAPN
jgi:hypothetical protein